MSDPVRLLYAGKPYPALSHPATHPSRLAAAARLAGLAGVASPPSCRVLEFGCASGHNLLPLAEAYPGSRFVGVDFSGAAIAAARESARVAGLANVAFHEADLGEWEPDGEFDFVIAHGVFSWVEDALKGRLLDLCARALAPGGVACIGYNTLPGWSLRRDVAPLVRALARSPLAAAWGDGAAVAARLAELPGGQTAYAGHLRAVCGGMARKGPEVLPFDDFAPVCDPVYFGHFVAWAGERGLRCLGEADPAENLPEGIEPGILKELAPLAADPVLLQQTFDLLSGRTHRNSLLCRASAGLRPGEMSILTDIVVVADRGEPPVAEHPAARSFREALLRSPGRALAVRAFAEGAGGGVDAGGIFPWVLLGLGTATLGVRMDLPRFEASVPERLSLSPLNLHFVRSGLPVVDVWHVTPRFPPEHERLMAAMDGVLAEELERKAATACPELDFRAWIAHLAARGLFRHSAES